MIGVGHLNKGTVMVQPNEWSLCLGLGGAYCQIDNFLVRFIGSLRIKQGKQKHRADLSILALIP